MMELVGGCTVRSGTDLWFEALEGVAYRTIMRLKSNLMTKYSPEALEPISTEYVPWSWFMGFWNELGSRHEHEHVGEWGLR